MRNHNNLYFQMNRNINWHPNTGNNIYYASESGFLTSQIWMNDLEDDIQASGVEIVELNSTDNSRSSSEEPDPRADTPHASHPWSYADGWKDLEKANRQARIRAHLRNLNSFPQNSDLEYNDGIEYFNNSDCPTPDTADIETFQQTCFSILDKLSALKFDSSSDLEESSNEARCGDVLLEPDWNREPSGEMVAYSSEVDGEKQTIWIYSFNKNSHVLSDHDYELVKIPSQDSVTCSSNSSENDELNIRTKSHRVASPIPVMHIPRLDLSLGATLPNVTEVTEPKSMEYLKVKKYVPITQKPANNWCLDNSEKVTKSKASNIVDWMGLSPRDRMESRHISVGIKPLELVPEVSHDEDKPQLHGQFVTGIEVESESKSFKQDKPLLNPFETQDASVISTSNSSVHSHRTSISSNKEKLENKTYLITPSAQRHEDLEFPHDNKELYKLDVIRTLFDRGDCKVESHIKIANPFLLSPKSNPIENIDRDSIAEQKYYRKDRRCLSAGDNSQISNLSFKSAEWTAYFPITGSRLNIVLPVEPEINDKKTFFQRCFGCFKCCK